MISEREKLEFESLPEFVREPRANNRDSYNPRPAQQPKAAPPPTSRSTHFEEDPALPKTAELEALWPGVNHDIFHTPRKGPSFYLTIGFMAGAVVSLALVWSVSFIGQMSGAPAVKKEIVVSRAGGTTAGASGTTVSGSGGDSQSISEVIMPASPMYEVAAGDTLAAIALKNYHRATPRLLDEICRANNMRNANVLSLGQKLVLPEYRPQRLAAGANTVQQ